MYSNFFQTYDQAFEALKCLEYVEKNIPMTLNQYNTSRKSPYICDLITEYYVKTGIGYARNTPLHMWIKAQLNYCHDLQSYIYQEIGYRPDRCQFSDFLKLQEVRVEWLCHMYKQLRTMIVKNIILDRLGLIKMGDRRDNVGLCSNILNPYTRNSNENPVMLNYYFFGNELNRELNRELTRVFEAWPKYSGDQNFPIINQNRYLAYASNKFDDHLRLELLDFCINFLENDLKN